MFQTFWRRFDVVETSSNHAARSFFSQNWTQNMMNILRSSGDDEKYHNFNDFLKRSIIQFCKVSIKYVLVAEKSYTTLMAR